MARDNRTDAALTEIFEWLEAREVRPADLHGLELFAGDGRRQVEHYADRLASVELWEIDPECSRVLQARYPLARVRTVDSIHALATEDDLDRYDFVAVDNPLTIFGPDGRYCEHFEVLPHLHRVLAPRAVVLLDLVPRPYGARQQPEWMARRSAFYGIEDAEDVDVDVMMRHYTDHFDRAGWSTRHSTAVCREYDAGRDYFWYAALVLEHSDVDAAAQPTA